MAGPKRRGESAGSAPGGSSGANGRDGELDRRMRELDVALAARRPAADGLDGRTSARGMSGIGVALRLSSEFIAAILVGAGLGWFIDRMAGTSPWGLIVLLFLGFGAGVLNVLRSAGRVAEFGAPTRAGTDDRGDRPGDR